MAEILDIHTHHQTPQPNAIVNMRIGKEQLEILPGQFYSVGLHPWDVENSSSLSDCYELFENKDVVAIGECGVDLVAKTPMFIQLQLFKKQIDVSEELNKPMIIHAVKGADIICGLRRDLKPQMPWCIHGFRGKPQAAQQLIKAGCHISFGEKFNPDTLLSIPKEFILAETDESLLTIEEIIKALSEVKGFDLTPIIKENSKKFLNFVS